MKPDKTLKDMAVGGRPAEEEERRREKRRLFGL